MIRYERRMWVEAGNAETPRVLDESINTKLGAWNPHGGFDFGAPEMHDRNIDQ